MRLFCKTVLYHVINIMHFCSNATLLQRQLIAQNNKSHEVTLSTSTFLLLVTQDRPETLFSKHNKDKTNQWWVGMQSLTWERYQRPLWHHTGMIFWAKRSSLPTGYNVSSRLDLIADLFIFSLQEIICKIWHKGGEKNKQNTAVWL